jgi:hypothetical protein
MFHLALLQEEHGIGGVTLPVDVAFWFRFQDGLPVGYLSEEVFPIKTPGFLQRHGDLPGFP